MLYNLEPDRSVSGGAWYQDQDFESEFVDILNRQCLRFLQQRADKIKNNPRGPIIGRTQSYATAAEVQKYITDLGISNVSNFCTAYLYVNNKIITKIQPTNICPNLLLYLVLYHIFYFTGQTRS